MDKKDIKAKAAFLKGFNWPNTKDIFWLGSSGFIKMSKERNARIELVERGHGDKYEGLEVVLIDKNKGIINSKYFSFEEHLECAERKESRTSCYGGMTVHSSVGWDWYIERPKDTSPICKDIFNYIDLFN